MTRGTSHIESRQCMPRLGLRPLTPNERFWLEVIRLSSWDSDPAPTLKRVQQLRRIFEPTGRGGTR
ncbi:hypothetical protein [Bosea sp. (in: a-proteobacteria)]|uniref:hypothetical protein n=1 Tax=Bosea sp. (in: a-proteobacteria) TaxID=1871050 RepID=UPI0031FF2E8B